ncbi:MAG: conjugative transposon protein TraM [Bacteroidetes bacterium]|nr:conjugative transposon protein TraM [Bacteroidota bacterium]
MKLFSRKPKDENLVTERRLKKLHTIRPVHPEKLKQRKRFFLVLPVFVIAFALIMFVLLGGGKGAGAKSTKPETALNVKLPDAHFKKGKDKNKLSFYELAKRDSNRLKELIKNDPYYTRDSSSDTRSMLEKKYLRDSETSIDKKFGAKEETDKNEAALLERMEQIKKEISRKSEDPKLYQQRTANYPSNPHIERLERISRMMNNRKEDASDPEMEQINEVLNKIIAIQHPDNIIDTSKNGNAKQKQLIYPVSKGTGEENISVMGQAAGYANQNATHNSFYGLDDETNVDKEKHFAIKAIIPETQTLVSGATIKIELITPIRVQGVSIPAGHLVYGIASLSNERLKIEIKSISNGQAIFPVSLDVYDIDGIAGIYIPGNISREVGKQSAELGVNGLGIQTLDQSLGAQAASAGIQAAKSLIGKKIKMIRVTVRSGYQVLLRNNAEK